MSLKKIKQPAIVIISGPSGVGKDTVMRELARFKLPLRRVTTTTSRPKRPGEREGKPYHFVTERRFLEMIRIKKFAEHAKVFTSWKGITRVELEKVAQRSRGVLLQIEHQGARTIKQLYPHALVIVITPPSINSLNQRLAGRGDKQAKELATRIKQNRQWRRDYRGFDHYVPNNDGQAKQAATTIASIISRYLGQNS